MSEIQQGLLITGIGMGLVFAVIIFLWGLMALMMRVMSRQKPVSVEEKIGLDVDELLVPEMQVAEAQRRAVAAAVAVEMAYAVSESRNSQKHDQGWTRGLSPWQAVHRARQLENKKTRG